MGTNGRVHVTTADGFVTDENGNAVGFFGGDCRKPNDRYQTSQDVADVVAYRLDTDEWMNGSMAKVRGLPTLRQLGRIEVKKSRDGRIYAYGQWAWDESIGSTKAGEALLAAVAKFYEGRPDLTADLSAEQTRDYYLSRTVGQVRLDSGAYHASREYLNAGGDRATLRAALIEEFTRSVDANL